MQREGFRRLVLVGAGLALAAGAGAMRWSTPPEDAVPPAVNDPKAITYRRTALRRDDASPYRWADLAEALAAAGRVDEARRCFERALALAPGIPQIWMRHANFCFLENAPKAALQSSARVLQSVPDYDEILFHEFDQMIADPREVMGAIRNNRRALNSWLNHLIRANHAQGAALAWKEIASPPYEADAALARSYVDFLLRRQAWGDAVDAWALSLGPRRGDYPQGNLMVNGRFEFDPSGSALDWHMANDSGEFKTVREAHGARVEFGGKSNVPFDHLWQTVVLLVPGTYRLSAQVKSEGITTDEGPRLAVTDLGAATESFTGTRTWTPVSLEFHVPQPRAVRVGIIRRTSWKFDNKIAGSFWVTDVAMINISSHARPADPHGAFESTGTNESK